MERELRHRSAGLIFYILFALLICSSSVVSGKIDEALSPIFTESDDVSQSTNTVIEINTEQYPKFLVNIEEFQAKNGNSFDSNLLIAIVGIGITIFTSDSVGYIISTIFVFLFNCWGGYSEMYKNGLTYKNYNEILLEDLQNALNKSPDNDAIREFSSSIKTFKHDPLLIFFLHHTKDLPEYLDKWIERRHTSFISGGTNVISILLTEVFAFFVFKNFHLEPTDLTWKIIGLSILIIGIILYNGYNAEKDVLQVLDLRIASKLNPQIQNIYDKYNNPSENNNSTDSASETKPFFELTFQKIIKLFSHSSRKE